MKPKQNGRTGQLRGGAPAPSVPVAAAAASAVADFGPRKMLVPIDFSAPSLQALELALRFAAQFQARIVLLHVVEPIVSVDQGLRVVPDSSNLLVEESRERLEALSRKRGMERYAVETLVRIGHAHSEITDTANALGVDLIVIARQGNSELRNITLGSTADKVLRHAACAVLTLPPYAGH